MAERIQLLRSRDDDAPPQIVVCGQCRYLLGDRCDHPSARRLVTTWKNTVIELQLASDKNAHNDCRDFAPIPWWEELGLDDPLILLIFSLVGWVMLAVFILERIGL